MSNQKHKFHLVDRSPWPLLVSWGSFLLTLGTSMVINTKDNTEVQIVLILGLIATIITASIWWRDVIREGTYQGHHSFIVQKGLRLGMILFIVSEIMFFFAFFRAFFHSSLAPTIEIGSLWPPKGIQEFNPFGIPLLNTFILLLSGITVTYTHQLLLANNTYIVKRYTITPKRGMKQVRFVPTLGYTNKEIIEGFRFTIGLAILFTIFQALEYLEAPFSIKSGIYGSTFFLTTGFHGIHVIIGTIFIIICYIRYILYHYSPKHHFGFEAAAWYWHFVDAVWFVLYLLII